MSNIYADNSSWVPRTAQELEKIALEKIGNQDFINDPKNANLLNSAIPGKSQISYSGHAKWRTASKFVNIFQGLKPNTKYKICSFVNFRTAGKWGGGSSGSEVIDVTYVCRPIGSSVTNNTHARNLPTYLISDANGNLSVEIKTEQLTYRTGTKFNIQQASLAYLTVNAERVQSALNNGFSSSSATTAVKAVEYSIVDDKDTITAQPKQILDNDTTGSRSNEDSGGADSGTVLVNSKDNEVPNDIVKKVVPGYVQSFFVDPNQFVEAQTIDVTDIDLYFRDKPKRTDNESGIQDPGVKVYLLYMNNNSPNLEKRLHGSICYKKWNEIVASSDASIPTKFTFSKPVRLSVGNFYAFGVEFEDTDYLLWASTIDHALVGTATSSPGSSREHRGDLFEITNVSKDNLVQNNDYISKPIVDIDLKFDIYSAEYSVGDISLDFTNPNYEFITLKEILPAFIPQEYVYQDVSDATGTISIEAGKETLVGTGTSFTSLNVGDSIVLVDSSNTNIQEIGVIDRIISDTQIELKEPCITDIDGNYKVAPIALVEVVSQLTNQLILSESTANSTVKFEENGTIYGITSEYSATIDALETYPVSVFRTDIEADIPNAFELTALYNFSYDDNGTYRTSNNSTFEKELLLYDPNHVRDYNGIILSRSLEIDNTTYLYNNDKSMNLQVNLDYVGNLATTYDSPEVSIDNFQIITTSWLINNDATNEHTNNGNAITKHISKKLKLNKGVVAEDVRVIYNAYRPTGTNVKCYVKIINENDPADFDSKNWTEMELIDDPGFSSLENRNDYREFEFRIPATPPVERTLAGTVDTETDNANSEIVGFGTTFTTDLTAGDIIKVYSPVFPSEPNYGIFSVLSVDADDRITLTERITNNNIIDTGLKIDILSTPHTAFINPDNYNIVRYFDTNGASYDGYVTLAVKTVLLGEDSRIVPRVNDYRVIAVSA